MKGVWSQLDKEVERTPMPDEYKEFYVYVLCKDCHKVSNLSLLLSGIDTLLEEGNSVKTGSKFFAFEVVPYQKGH